MFNRIDGINPFVINKIEPTQKNGLKNQRNNQQSLSDEREKLNMQRAFLEALKENGVDYETSAIKAEEGYTKRKRR